MPLQHQRTSQRPTNLGRIRFVEYHQVPSGVSSAHAEVKRFMSSTRGNPNWGRPMQPVPNIATEFEIQVRHLHLTTDAYAASTQLRRWCEQNRNRFYIPEWLLKEWAICVNDDLTGAA